MPIHQKKRKFEMGRVPTMTKLGAKKIISVRGRGGNITRRALRNDHGTFSWASEGMSAKTRVLDIVYNATNNELALLAQKSLKLRPDAAKGRDKSFEEQRINDMSLRGTSQAPLRAL